MKASLAQLRNQHRARLCDFHFEEAAFLYEQRQALLQDPGLPWVELEPIEQRAETHLRALIVHGDVALEKCAEEASSGVGELHVALRVYAHQKDWPQTLSLCTSVDMHELAIKQAVIEALLMSAPESWICHLTALLKNADHELQRVAARVLGCRRKVDSGLLLDVLRKLEPVESADIIWALGRSGQNSDAEALSDYLYLDDEQIAEAAAIAMLRLGSTQPEQVALDQARKLDWPANVLALAQTERSVAALEDIVRATPSEQNIRALGICGLAVIEVLLPLLSQGNLAFAAAQALQMITGAGLLEEVWVADGMAKEELFDDEFALFEKNGKLPTRTDGLPFGQREFRVSQNREEWETWLEGHEVTFDPGTRYRYGRPVSREQTLGTLTDHAQSTPMRQTVAHELVIHYQSDIAFEADWPAKWQRESLERCRRV